MAISGDYDFQFMIEELAVGAQFNLPYIHVVVNNSYLGSFVKLSANLTLITACNWHLKTRIRRKLKAMASTM
ncbi:glyoxylate carboligase [Vibrio maritimus]|uniref:Glyoxylate carboligase n=1 Tax=Vibrio maritimus TaxID=990268 RepID=A0A090RWR6_9VIBR|nr:glyoxylate carboligase [Vibrio maritimus]